jgi:hypothetical protein
MNIEKLEFDLVQLNDKPVVVVAPSFGHVSFSYAGNLSVIKTSEHTVGFHLTNQLGGVAIIFFADDVEKLEKPSAVCEAHVIRLKGPHQYPERFVGVDDWKK